nr:integrase, catalytic region, zinc finger, CCHC-type, peptidase aspartic, catalytic [Tanacetum cinerariifolium]
MSTQQDINAIRAQRLANTHDLLGLMANTQAPFHPDQSSFITYLHYSQLNNNFIPQPSFNTNYMQQPMQNPKDIANPTTTIDMALVLMAKEFTLNDTTPTNNNQRSSSNPSNMQITQPGIANQYEIRNVVTARAKANGACEETERENVNCTLYNNLQQALTFGTQSDKALVCDSDGSAENNSNVISAVSSVKQGGGTVEQHSATVQETRAYHESLFHNLAVEVEKANLVNRKMKEKNDDLTTELARYKNQEKCFKISQEKYDKLERCYQKSVYHEQFPTKKINALHLSSVKEITTLNEEIANLNNELSKEKSTISSLQEEKKKLKSDFKICEDELLDKQIQLENKIKELDNILVKIASSAKQHSSYSGKVLLEKHDPPTMYDSEEMLQLAQESHLKMKQLNKKIKLANYTKINHLSGVFVSQMAKLREELYFLNTFKMANVSKPISIPNEEFSEDTTPSVARKFLNEVKSTIVTLQRVVKQKMTLDTENWSSSVYQDIHKIVKDEIFPIVNQVDARFQNFKLQFLKEAAKFVRDFKYLAKEADESLAKHKALELEINRLLRAVVSQDIMSIIQSNSVVDTSNLQTELERIKEHFENCIIKKEDEYAKLCNDWYKKCEECKYEKISCDKAYNEMQQKNEWLQAPLGDLNGTSKDTPGVSNTFDPLFQKLDNENVELEFQIGTFRETLDEGEEGALHLGLERDRFFTDLSPKEKDRYNADIRATNILLQGLPKEIYTLINYYTNAKDIWDNYSSQSSTNPPSTFVPPVTYQPHFADNMQLDSGLSLIDNLIENLTNTFSLLTQSYKTYLPQTNNQLRTSSNIRNQDIVQDGKVVVQNVQGRQNRGQGTIKSTQVLLVIDEFKTELGMQILVKQDRLSVITAMLLFLEGGHDTVVDEDVDELPVQDLELNVDNVFQADKCDAFDSDVDEAPTALTMFMANMSSPDLVYDEAGPSYDLNILSEVYEYDNYQDAVYEQHEAHEMHHNIQPNCVVNLKAAYTSDSNMIPYDQVLPTKSQVKINIFSFIQLFWNLTKPVKRELHQQDSLRGKGFEQIKECYLTEVIPFFKTLKEYFEGIQKALTKEIKEMKEIFEELKAEVDQDVVNRKYDEIKRKNLLITNDNLIAECLSKEVFYVATNSELTVSRFSKMHDAHTTIQARCLELEAELSKLKDKIQKDDHNEMVKHFSNLEVNHSNLQLKYQHLKESFRNNKSLPARDAPDLDLVVEIRKMKASIQVKDNAIKKLRMHISQLKETRSEADQNSKIKLHYKELYDSIKITRAKDIEQTTALLTENENLKAKINEKMKCVTMDSIKPRVLAPGRYAINVKPSLLRIRNNREVYLDYLKHLKESVETLREIVEEARVVQIVLWYLDSGCSKHMTGNRSRVRDFVKKFIGTVKFGNDHFGAFMGYGDYVIGDSVISKIFCMEGLRLNLFSIRKFYDFDLEVSFRKHSCYVRDTDGAELIKVTTAGTRVKTVSESYYCQYKKVTTAQVEVSAAQELQENRLSVYYC